MKRYAGHPDGVILDHLLGELDGEERETLVEHLADCPKCRDREDEWREVLDLAVSSPACAGAAPSPPLRGLARQRAGWLCKPRSVVRLTSPGEDLHGRTAAGRIRDGRDGTAELSVHGLEPLPVGRVYVLWCCRIGACRSVGAFAVDGAGAGALVLPWPLAEPRAGVRLLVTAEAHANEPNPRGPVRLAGECP